MAFKRLLAVALAGFVMLGASPAGRTPSTAGQKIWTKDAPDFSVRRYSDGRSIALSDVRGKVALLFFFFPT